MALFYAAQDIFGVDALWRRPPEHVTQCKSSSGFGPLQLRATREQECILHSSIKVSKNVSLLIFKSREACWVVANVHVVAHLLVFANSFFFMSPLHSNVSELQRYLHAGTGEWVSFQVVFLGAGMDSRPWRLTLGNDISWWEVDTRDVVTVKQRLLVQNTGDSTFAAGTDLSSMSNA